LGLAGWEWRRWKHGVEMSLVCLESWISHNRKNFEDF
jgi:hypothetical protein